ncbi:hypothetical protein RN001_011977 [Aquatica leii]|uniref:Uncharacterized protein n=1 Tax=Aquatica leii TaxID=1421715 RepID=A0AAN7Q181_9COLE|nr:hypothetical protein RN001_011977 [Aquatica leii]
MYNLLVFTSILAFLVVVQCNKEGDDVKDGLQVLSKLFRHFINSQPEDYKLTDGVHLISTSTSNDITSRAVDDTSLMGVIENYIQTHEVRIKFVELMPNGQDLARAFKSDNDEVNLDVGTGRGKNKGGSGGALVMLGGMFASMMGALGLGGVGLLAMKALAVSAMALMLAGIVGIKALASGGHHDDHRVIHAGGDHRKKREAAEMAYNAWFPHSM